jgi:hypothetical protein
MGIESAFETMQRRLEDLKGELSELRVNAEDFYPIAQHRMRRGELRPEEAPPPVVALADAAADLEGDVEEALKAAREAVLAVRQPRDLTEAQRATCAIQRGLDRVLRRQLVEVAAYDPLHTLVQMGDELGDSWPKWAELVRSVVSKCIEHLVEAFHALAECWQELADKLASNLVSIQSTNIGQQIKGPRGLASSMKGAA